MTYTTRYRDEVYERAVAQWSPLYGMARYVASAAPVSSPGAGLVLRGDVLVRLTPDDVVGGFWKEVDGRVEFVPYAGREGVRVLAAWALLGLRLPVRKGA